MKFEKIIAAVMTLALTTGTFGTAMTAASADVSDISTESDDGQQSYSINIADTGNADVTVVDSEGNQISSYTFGQLVNIMVWANEGHKVSKVIMKYDNGETKTSRTSSPVRGYTYTFRGITSNMTVTVVTVPDEPITPVNPINPPEPITPDPEPAPTWKKGDANCDGRVNAEDATAILKLLVGNP
ncbi:MAG: hypothetical protein HDT42_00305 [Ruminococcaceae bacterium]|nr:hypothetical protein [Oscillospiraceae bacterium]